MKQDIDFPKVEGVKLAIAREKNEIQEYDWYVYLLNYNDFTLNNILITSKGYGEKDGEQQKTSTLRHLIENLDANTFTKVEKIEPAVFHLVNEYWLSYYIDRKIYDKKFLFLPDTIIESNLIMLDMLELEGILHS